MAAMRISNDEKFFHFYLELSDILHTFVTSKRDKKMKYEIEVLRTSYSSKVFEVEADCEAEARDKALGKAYDTVFTEYDADYEIATVSEVKDFLDWL